MSDTWKTIATPAEGLFKDRGSRFISFIYPVRSEEDIKEVLLRIKKEHHSARHHCYAWRLGIEEIHFRFSDDGEPSSTAGKPILGQLTSNDLTQVLLVVVRYFGGTLLGVSGLINAYREAAADAIRNATIENLFLESEYRLEFTYKELNVIMQIMKNENLTQKAIQLTDKCHLDFSVRKSEASRIEQLFQSIYGVKIRFNVIHPE
jgi:uncharacterized YigZ family protein